MEETKTVFLADGRKVVLDDDDELILSLVSNNKTEDTCTVPYPSDDWEEEETDVGTFMFSEINGSQFSVIVPWGEVTFCEPLEDILVVRLK